MLCFASPARPAAGRTDVLALLPRREVKTEHLHGHRDAVSVEQDGCDMTGKYAGATGRWQHSHQISDVAVLATAKFQC